MKYTKKEQTAIKKCIKMWEKIRDLNPIKCDWNIHVAKKIVYPRILRIKFGCFLCIWNPGKGACDVKCPLQVRGGKDDGVYCCSAGQPYSKLVQTKNTPHYKPHWKLYCQQIIDKCKKALEE